MADAVDTRIAVGDWGCATRFEFDEIMARGRVDVVQPSSVRSGGMSESVLSGTSDRASLHSGTSQLLVQTSAHALRRTASLRTKLSFACPKSSLDLDSFLLNYDLWVV
jgi:hypothetical protein